MQEVLELFALNEAISEPNDASPAEEQMFLVISQESISGVASPRTMQFAGLIQDMPIVVLVDSGSTTSFLSTHVADKMQSVTLSPASYKVQVTNGDILQCSAIAENCCWSMAAHSFTHSLKLLPLSSYDIVVGMDWLEKFSPMRVDWRNKWMQIPMGASTVVLHGSPEFQSSDMVFQLLSVQLGTQPTSKASQLPADIVQLLQDFQSVCDLSSELSPVRPYDHTIMLVQGARPVNIRPYRYPPALKDEIEAQVT
ncbi:uncharacterized protein [Miscanthus floridulus]|uniref:uncharacterized protein n=1 Tax=Miscanthus floridulus TaxID=154761 RepID=UPI00345950C3